MLTDEHREKINYLNQYKYLDSKIDRKIKELENCKSKIFNITGTLSDMPKSPNRSNTIEEGITKLDEIESEINKDIDLYVDTRKEIEKIIEKVTNLYLREVLELRYLDFKRFEEIAYRKDCSIRHIYRLHEQALDEVII